MATAPRSEEALAADSAALAEELGALDPTLRARLASSAFDPAWLVTRAKALRENGSNAALNRVAGPVSAPRPEQIAPIAKGEMAALRKLGNKALATGEVALCVLAGGMATRMGSVVKALVEVVPGLTFLAARLAEQRAVSKKSKHALPLWLMTSEATDTPIRKALAASDAPAEVATFRQGVGLRLDTEGRLFRDSRGAPSPYATGHGDVVDALRASKLLDDFRAGGGKWVLITNLDNLGASIDPVYVGACIKGQAQMLVETCRKEEGDRGGMPVLLDGRLQVLEEFRLPVDFDGSTVPVFSTNSMWVRADALAEVKVPWNWFTVEKKVEDRTAIQFERLMQELTSVLDARYVEVPRHGETSRFLPVKDKVELERRGPTLAAMLRARGFIESP